MTHLEFHLIFTISLLTSAPGKDGNQPEAKIHYSMSQRKNNGHTFIKLTQGGRAQNKGNARLIM